MHMTCQILRTICLAAYLFQLICPQDVVNSPYNLQNTGHEHANLQQRELNETQEDLDDDDEDNSAIQVLRDWQMYAQSNNSGCVAGTNRTLGIGKVQQYGVERFVDQARTAVQRANLLTRLWTLSNYTFALEEFFYEQVINLVNTDPEIFGAGNCYDKLEFNNRFLFCPYAYRYEDSNGQERILVKDLSVDYKYLKETSEWFYIARKKANNIIATRKLTDEYTLLRYNDSHQGTRRLDKVLLVEYKDGHWSEPYYDCMGGNIWMMTYTVPFFGLANGTYKFKGTSGIDIALQKMDIDQCPQNTVEPGQLSNPFANSSRCHPSTKCVPIKGQGFKVGSYKCECRDGFYFPELLDFNHTGYFNGALLEGEFDLKKNGEPNRYDELHCLPCAEGCETCVDDSPCTLTLDFTLRGCILVLSMIIIMSAIPVLGTFVWLNRKVKVLKAASPMLLGVILFGAFLLYCPMIVNYFEATVFTCSLRLWFRGIGFPITYGAILLKTWRVSVVFRVRSAQRVKLSDSDLTKRLAVIVLGFIGYLTVRNIWGQPKVVEGLHQSDLKTKQCSFDVWDYMQSAGELLLLICGIRLCIMVRKAPSQFNESRFISWAIYNETLLSIFLHLSVIFLRSPSNPDLLYVVQFIHINLTITGTLLFLFLSKGYLIYKMKGQARNGKSGNGSISSKKGFQYSSSKKSIHGPEMKSEEMNDSKDCMETELKRLHMELRVYKELEMRRGNPHLPLKVIGPSGSKSGIMDKISHLLSSSKHTSADKSMSLTSSVNAAIQGYQTTLNYKESALDTPPPPPPPPVQSSCVQTGPSKSHGSANGVLTAADLDHTSDDSVIVHDQPSSNNVFASEAMKPLLTPEETGLHSSYVKDNIPSSIIQAYKPTRLHSTSSVDVSPKRLHSASSIDTYPKRLCSASSVDYSVESGNMEETVPLTGSIDRFKDRKHKRGKISQMRFKNIFFNLDDLKNATDV